MSLINDALKKAQRQRTAENAPLPPMPATAGGAGVRVVQRRKPLDFQSLYARLGIGAAVLLFLIVAGFLVWHFATRPAAPVPQTAVAPAQSAATETPSQPAPAPIAVAPKPDAPPVQSAAASGSERTPPPVPTVSAPAPAVKPSEPSKGTPLPTVSTAAAPKAPAEAPAADGGPISTKAGAAPPPQAASPPRPDPRILVFIDNLRVTGIRSAGADSKVLMNDRVYRINDVIDYQHGLKLTAVGANALTFIDERGAVYRKDF